MKRRVRKGIVFGILSILIFYIFKSSPSLTDLIYGNAAYPTYQFLRSVISYIIPIPLIYIIVSVFLLYLLRQIYKMIRRKPSFFKIIHKSLAIIGYIICAFYLLWGYNYARTGVAENLHLELHSPDSAFIFGELERTILTLNELRNSISSDSVALPCHAMEFEDLHKNIKRDMVYFLRNANYSTAIPTFVLRLKPQGILLRFKTAGMFFPFSGEGYIDSGIPDVNFPFTYAHELAHVFGVTDEGEANFIAYQVCRSNMNNFIRYSGYLTYYMYLRSACRNYNVDKCISPNERIQGNVIADLNQRDKCLAAFSDIFPALRDKVYDTFLRSQGLSEGINSYNKLITLEYAWQQRQE